MSKGQLKTKGWKRGSCEFQQRVSEPRSLGHTSKKADLGGLFMWICPSEVQREDGAPGDSVWIQLACRGLEVLVLGPYKARGRQSSALSYVTDLWVRPANKSS